MQIRYGENRFHIHRGGGRMNRVILEIEARGRSIRGVRAARAEFQQIPAVRRYKYCEDSACAPYVYVIAVAVPFT